MLYWNRVGPKCNDWYPYKERQILIQRHKQRGDSHVKKETEIGMMKLPAKPIKDCWQPPEARRET